jgi:hypothetical protein
MVCRLYQPADVLCCAEPGLCALLSYAQRNRSAAQDFWVGWLTCLGLCAWVPDQPATGIAILPSVGSAARHNIGHPPVLV